MARVFVLGNFIHVGCWFIPRLPQHSDTLFASNIHFEPGGKGLNVAVGLRRLGLHVDTLIGIGDDAPAKALLELCQREGISTEHIHQFSGSSGWGSGWVGDDGQYAGAVYLGANLALEPTHAAKAQQAIESAQLVYGQFETALPVVQAAFAIAHAKGIPTVLNPSPWQPPPESLYTTTHTLLVNEIEVQYLLARQFSAKDVGQGSERGPGQSAIEPIGLADWAAWLKPQLGALWAQWTALSRLVVTLGALGSVAFERSGKVCLCAAPHIEAVDSVGAGDAFACGYCLAFLGQQSLATALRWGNASGADVASKVGVLTALPTAAALEQRLPAVPAPQWADA